MKYIIPGLLLFLSACTQKHLKEKYTGPAVGRIVGGAFWRSKTHFGDYPPDARCSVFLYRNDTSHIVSHTTGDADGNFIFYDLQNGLYLVLIRSNHVRTNCIYNFSQIDNAPCKDFIHLDLQTLNRTYYDSTKYFDSIYNLTLANELKETTNSLIYPELKKKEAWADSCRNASAFLVLKRIPKTKLSAPLITDSTSPMKIHLQAIEVVHGKSKPIVVNFSENDF